MSNRRRRYAAAFIDALGVKKLDALGFSLGGLVAQQFTVERPEDRCGMKITHTIAVEKPRSSLLTLQWSRDVDLTHYCNSLVTTSKHFSDIVLTKPRKPAIP